MADIWKNDDVEVRFERSPAALLNKDDYIRLIKESDGKDIIIKKDAIIAIDRTIYDAIQKDFKTSVILSNGEYYKLNNWFKELYEAFFGIEYKEVK